MFTNTYCSVNALKKRSLPVWFNTSSIGLLLFVLSLGAQAQIPPIPPTDAGRILNQIEQTTLPNLQPDNQPEIDVIRQSRPPLKAGDQTRFLVNSFVITGNSVIPAAELQSKLDLLTGKTLTLDELRAAADEIGNYYRSKGYLVARAYIPAQQIINGVVEIQIIEGRRDKINFKSLGDPIVEPSVQVEFVNTALGKNKVISESDLERALLLLGDTPGVSNVQSSLAPGEIVGTSDLNLVTTAGPRFFGSVDADNFGGRYSGSDRVGATFGLNSLSGLGDQLTFRVQTTGANSMQQGSQTNYGRVAYQMPVGSDGAKVGVAYAAMRYQLGLNYQGTNTNGVANTASAFVTYPFVRSRNFNLYGQAGFDNIGMYNNSFGFQLSQMTVNQGTLGVSGNSRDSILGGGINSFGVTGSFGHVGSGNAGYNQVDDLTAQTLGSFSKAYLNFSRLQAITGDVHLVINMSGQVSSQNLNSSQLFTLGGPNGVRAYPVGQAAGAQGGLVQIELHQKLLDESSPVGAVSGFAFYDAGVMQLYKNTWSGWANPNPSTGAVLENHTSLQGAGLGLKTTVTNAAYVSLTWAHSIGQSQSMRVYGVNANGLSNSNTFWFQGVAQF